MLSIFLSSILTIFGILMGVIGTLGLIGFIIAIVSWVVEGELGYYEGNPWLLLILWFVIATILGGAGFTLVRIFG